MQTQQLSSTEIREKISELRQRYTRFALQCRASGLRVNPETIAEYAQEIEALEAQLA